METDKTTLVDWTQYSPIQDMNRHKFMPISPLIYTDHWKAMGMYDNLGLLWVLADCLTKACNNPKSLFSFPSHFCSNRLKREQWSTEQNNFGFIDLPGENNT